MKLGTPNRYREENGENLFEVNDGDRPFVRKEKNFNQFENYLLLIVLVRIGEFRKRRYAKEEYWN